MAAASQAASGEFDSRRLLQRERSAMHSALFVISDGSVEKRNESVCGRSYSRRYFYGRSDHQIVKKNRIKVDE